MRRTRRTGATERKLGSAGAGSAKRAPLVDSLGRVHRALRLSVTDRCNLRCRYCMPAAGLDWLSSDSVLSDDEIVELVGLLATCGVTELRLTGGEPLVRPRLAELVARLRRLPGIEEISLTTNGVLLAAQLPALVEAGLARVNVSIDSLDPDRFEEITRRRDLQRALEGLEACEQYEHLRPIKVNAVALRGVSEPDVLPLAELAREKPYVVRFIEVMPLDAPREWTRGLVLSGEELREMIRERWPLEPRERERPSAPGTSWRFADGQGEMQFVASVSEPFCGACDRLRLTADGQLRTCLFAEWETDLRGPLRDGASPDRLLATVRNAVGRKERGHGMDDPEWSYSGRPMSQIGG